MAVSSNYEVKQFNIQNVSMFIYNCVNLISLIKANYFIHELVNCEFCLLLS